MRVEASSGSGGGNVIDFTNAVCDCAEVSKGSYWRTFTLSKTSNVKYMMMNSYSSGFITGNTYDLANCSVWATVNIDSSGIPTFLNKAGPSITTLTLSGNTLTIGATDGTINNYHKFGVFIFEE